MILITQNVIKSNLKKYNFNEFDDKTVHLFNDILIKYTTYNLKKINRKYKKLEKVELQHIQSGGLDYSMPSEWYGVNSGKYHDIVQNVHVSKDLIRTGLEVNDPSGVIQAGGKTQFKISLATFDSALEESKSKLQLHDLKFNSKVKKILLSKFQSTVHDALTKVSKKIKSENFKSSDFSDVIKQKKFNSLN
jgi:hypothetical protein